MIALLHLGYYALGSHLNAIAAKQVFYSCHEQDDSDVKSFDESLTLIRQPRDVLITICGDYQQLTQTAILQWAKVIDRAPRFQFAQDCSKVKGYKLQVYGVNNPATKARCNYAGISTAFTIILGTPIIAVCSPQEAPYGPLNVLLHETGHLWGLCDRSNTHPDGTAFCGTALPHIMGGSVYGSGQLTEYDVQGIRKFAQDTQSH